MTICLMSLNLNNIYPIKVKNMQTDSKTLAPKSYPFLILLLSLFAIGPALGSGYWWGAHDARHSVYFLFEFSKAIRDGVLWPRWSPDFAFGYGYPFFNVYGPFSSYVGELFHLIGFDLVSSVKISFALSLLCSGLTMYAFARRLLGANGALVAAVAYVYFPYHIVDVYVRAALAESWALVWFPLVFWGFYECVKHRECVSHPRRRAVAVTAVAYALLFISHNGLAVPVTFLLVAWIAFWLFLPLREDGRWFWQQWQILRARLMRAMTAAAGGVLGIMLGGIFIFPWLLEYQYVNTAQWLAGYFSFTDHFVQAWQLFSPRWGFGVSGAGADDGFSFQLGLVPLLFAVAGWIIPLQKRELRQARLFFTVMFLLILFFMLEISRFVWESPLGDLILRPMQFPWRLLVLAGFALAFLAGFAARRAPTYVAILLACMIVAGSYTYLQAELIEPAEGPVGYAGLMRFQQSAGEMTGQSKWVALEDIPIWSPLADAWIAGSEVNSRFAYEEGVPAGNPVSNSYQEITEVKLAEPRTLRWMITDYPGWHAYRLALESDEILEELEIIRQAKTAHITIEAPAGHYRYMVRFEDTPVRLFGKLSSALSLFVVLLLLFWEQIVRRRS